MNFAAKVNSNGDIEGNIDEFPGDDADGVAYTDAGNYFSAIKLTNMFKISIDGSEPVNIGLEHLAGSISSSPDSRLL